MESRPTILLAAKHPPFRQILERRLALWGYRVLVAADGGEALRLLELPEPPRIALLDATLPQVDGAEICRRVRSRKQSIPQYLMLLTLPEAFSYHNGNHSAEADDVILKPFSSIDLRGRLRLGERILFLLSEMRRLAESGEMTNGSDRNRPGTATVTPLGDHLHSDSVRDRV